MHIFLLLFHYVDDKSFCRNFLSFSEYKYSRYPSATFSFLFINDFIYNRYWWFCKYTNRRGYNFKFIFSKLFWDNNASFSHAINTSPIPFQQMLSLLRALLNLILLRFINLANKLFRLIFTIIIFFSAYPHAAK